MKKFLVICCLFVLCGCSHSAPQSEFDGEICPTGGRNCYNVRTHYRVTRVEGIPRADVADNACNENAEFVSVSKPGFLDESFFYGANERACMATLSGCNGL